MTEYAKIAKILRHPHLRPIFPDPRPYKTPSFDLPPGVPLPLPPHIIHDLCVLAYFNQEFQLCETTLRIEERLASDYPCWEKRWAGMLCAWTKRAEMDWADVSRDTEQPVRKSGTWSGELHYVPLIRHSTFASRPAESPDQISCTQGDPLVTERKLDRSASGADHLGAETERPASTETRFR